MLNRSQDRVFGLSHLLTLVAGLLWLGALLQPLQAQEATAPEPLASATPKGSTSSRVGSFRVGNRTSFPVRLVILLRSGEKVINPEPAHWDFAPGEGGNEGLLLSLGEDPLEVGPGDVVVAFTLDGTRRYWGPSVVGESTAPFWDSEHKTWSMILQP